MTGRPFDDIRALVNDMPSPDTKMAQAVNVILSDETGLNPLGRTHTYLEWLAGWQGQLPKISRPLIAVFAGTHGITEQVFDKNMIESAQSRVKNMTEGSAGVRGIASSLQAAFKVYELGTEYPSDDFTQGPSLSEKDCAAAIAFGMEVVAEGADIIAIGNAGFGSATAAAGITRGLYGGASDYWAGGSGTAAKTRIAVVEKGANFHKDSLGDPLEVLRRFGGRDIAGMVGAILAARHQSIPVVLDGYVVCSAAAVLHKLNPEAISHCIAGHVTREPAHRALLDRIDLTPFLDLGIGIGDGTGAAFAIGALQSATEALQTLKTA